MTTHLPLDCRLPPTTTTTLENEPHTLVFEGRDSFPTPTPPPPSKTSRVSSLSTVETLSQYHHGTLPPSKTSTRLVFEGGYSFPTPPPSPPSETSTVDDGDSFPVPPRHHHIHLRKRAACAHFGGWILFSKSTTISTTTALSPAKTSIHCS